MHNVLTSQRHTRPDPKGPLRIGLLSTAAINTMALRAASHCDRVEVTAVASRDGVRGANYAAEHSILDSYSSYEDLLEESPTDAIYVSLPNSLHYEWALAALRSGKHVLCEKPFTRDPLQARTAIATSWEVDRAFVEAFMYAHHPQMSLAQELVADGAIGRLRAIRATYSHAQTTAGDVRLDPSLDGGAVMDVGCYCVSGCRLFAGEPSRVSATLVTGPTGVDLAAYALLEFPDDVVATIDVSISAPFRQGLELVGDGGTLAIQSPWAHAQWAAFLDPVAARALARPMVLGRVGAEPESYELDPTDAYRLELEHFADVVAGAAPLLGQDDALRQALVIDAIFRAASERCAVEVESAR